MKITNNLIESFIRNFQLSDLIEFRKDNGIQSLDDFKNKEDLQYIPLINYKIDNELFSISHNSNIIIDQNTIKYDIIRFILCCEYKEIDSKTEVIFNGRHLYTAVYSGYSITEFILNDVNTESLIPLYNTITLRINKHKIRGSNLPGYYYLIHKINNLYYAFLYISIISDRIYLSDRLKLIPVGLVASYLLKTKFDSLKVSYDYILPNLYYYQFSKLNNDIITDDYNKRNFIELLNCKVLYLSEFGFENSYKLIYFKRNEIINYGFITNENTINKYLIRV